MNDVILRIHVNAGKGKTEVVDIREEFVKISVSAPPEKGEANKKLIRFLSKILNIPLDGVEIINGFKQSRKMVRFRNVEREFLLNKLKENLKE